MARQRRPPAHLHRGSALTTRSTCPRPTTARGRHRPLTYARRRLARRNAGERQVTISATNQAPEFTTDLTDLTLAEGATVSLDANATDPEGNALTYSATALPAGVTIDPGTGVISGLLSSTTAGTYDITVTVSDGFLTDTDTFRLTVTNTNQAPVFTTNLPDRTDAVGAAVSLDADATDGDGDTLTYSATGLPDGRHDRTCDRRHQRARWQPARPAPTT